MPHPSHRFAATSAAGTRLAALRHARGLSQQRLAGGLGIDLHRLADVERGRARPPRGLLERAAGLLGVPAGFLLGEAAGRAAEREAAPAGGDDAGYDAVLSRLATRSVGLLARIGGEKRQAEATADELLSLPPRLRRRFLDENPDAVTLALGWRLLDLAAQAAIPPAIEQGASSSPGPAGLEALARLGLLVVARLAETPGRSTLEARAWSTLSEALRRRAVLPQSQRALTHARAALSTGWDPYEEALLEQAAGRLARAEGRREEAAARLERARDRLLSVAHPEESAAAAVELAAVWIECGEARRALAALAGEVEGEAAAGHASRAPAVEPPVEPAVAWAVPHLRALALALLGRSGEAWPLLAARRGDAAAAASRWPEIGWLTELAGLAGSRPEGEPERGLASWLDAAWRLLLAAGLAEPAARLGIELALAHARAGAPARAGSVAAALGERMAGEQREARPLPAPGGGRSRRGTKPKSAGGSGASGGGGGGGDRGGEGGVATRVQQRLRTDLRELRRLLRRLRTAMAELPPPDPLLLAEMEGHQRPFTLVAALRKDLEHVVELQLAEAVTELEIAARLDLRKLEQDWRGWREDRQEDNGPE